MTTAVRLINFAANNENWQPGNIVKLLEGVLSLLGTPNDMSLFHKDLSPYGILDINFNYMDKSAPNDILLTVDFLSSL